MVTEFVVSKGNEKCYCQHDDIANTYWLFDIVDENWHNGIAKAIPTGIGVFHKNTSRCLYHGNAMLNDGWKIERTGKEK